MKKLVVISTNFGKSFSGGCTATHEVFCRVQFHFSEIIVVSKSLGDHDIKKLRWFQFQNWLQAFRILKSLDDSHVFYGDFYNAYLFVLARKPFYFTYHDNWPELAKTSLKNKCLKYFFWPFYKVIFRHAICTITVSEFRNNLIGQYAKKLLVIRNGIKRSEVLPNTSIKDSVLMIGDISHRKYRYALDLFEILEEQSLDISFDIYGNVVDETVFERLSTFSFVNLKGFSSEINYEEYSCLVHASQMENLSLVWCEAIYHELPIVSFNVGGAEEVIGKENGVLIKPYNVQLMFNALKELLSGEITFDNANGLGDEYSWDVASDRYLEILR